MLCISTSFWVLCAPESWSKYFFVLFSTFFVQYCDQLSGGRSTQKLVEIHNSNELSLFLVIYKIALSFYLDILLFMLTYSHDVMFQWWDLTFRIIIKVFNSFFQERIANPRKEDNLKGVVQLIQQTGCYAVDSDSDHLNFDLCLLDKRTVKKITKYLGINVKWNL